MRLLAIAAGGLFLVVILLTQPTSAAGSRMILSRPVLNTAGFPHPTRITNPYLPMPPGTRYVYDGLTGGARTHVVIDITHQTKTLAGVPTLVTLDTVFVNGIIEEKTIDWFAQDGTGNVWYFGEFATQYVNGQPTGHEGSWQAGVNGAQAGIVMEAAPRVGDTYRQENAPPVAEDMATVLSLTASVSTPYGNFLENVLETKEFSPLEPGKVEHKFYEPGLGNVKTVGPAGSGELLLLTDIEDIGCASR